MKTTLLILAATLMLTACAVAEKAPTADERAQARLNEFLKSKPTSTQTILANERLAGKPFKVPPTACRMIQKGDDIFVVC